MKSALALAVSVLALEASAFWRLGCRGQLSIDGVDPIVYPGMTNMKEGHMHTIQGGGAFNATVDGLELQNSDCSSCEVIGDNSAYWTPLMYWKDKNGKFTTVKQDGGMLVYYLQRVGSGKVSDIVPFPQNFRMIAGQPALRSFDVQDLPTSEWTTAMQQNQTMLRQLAIGYNCLDYSQPATGAFSLRSIPTDKRCPDGLRAEIYFPSCWNGKDLGTDDPRDHMAYPNMLDDGDCPDDYPKRTMTLLFETIWAVDEFWGKDGQFVLSTGDPTGYSSHGDFMNGWEPDLLKGAIQTCTNDSGLVQDCPLFKLRSTSQMATCTVPPYIKATSSGAASMPGCNPIQSGPASATVPASCAGAATATATPKSSHSTAHHTSSAKSTPKPASSAAKTSSIAKPKPIPTTTSAAAKDGDFHVAEVSIASPSSSSVVVPVPAPAPSSSEAPAPVAPAAQNNDPAVVDVTVINYTTTAAQAVTVQVTEFDSATVTVEAAPVIVTETAAAKHRRHMDHHRRHARF